MGFIYLSMQVFRFVISFLLPAFLGWLLAQKFRTRCEHPKRLVVGSAVAAILGAWLGFASYWLFYLPYTTEYPSLLVFRGCELAGTLVGSAIAIWTILRRDPRKQTTQESQNDRSSDFKDLVAYLKASRRTIGLVARVMACVLALAWVWSHIFVNDVRMSTSGLAAIHVQSGRGVLAVCRNWIVPFAVDDPIVVSSEMPVLMPLDGGIFWGSMLAMSSGGDAVFYDSSDILLWPQFHYLKGSTSQNGQFGVSIPYWSIVIPLALLSVWLLRSKPLVPQVEKEPTPTSMPVN